MCPLRTPGTTWETLGVRRDRYFAILVAKMTNFGWLSSTLGFRVIAKQQKQPYPGPSGEPQGRQGITSCGGYFFVFLLLFHNEQHPLKMERLELVWGPAPGRPFLHRRRMCFQATNGPKRRRIKTLLCSWAQPQPTFLVMCFENTAIKSPSVYPCIPASDPYGLASDLMVLKG